jgi:hypothetical protein
MVKSKRDILVISLIIVIAILLGIVLYFFLIQPAINAQVINWANKGYTQAQVDIINTILSQIQENGYVSIPTGVENQTMILVPYQQPAD